MTARPLAIVVDALKSKDVVFEGGLTPTEFGDLEERYGFSFPPDLREFLSIGLPVSDEFPNWRTGKIKRGREDYPIVEIIDWPALGICFDVEHNEFWMKDWGPPPNDLQEAFKVARQKVKEAPLLIPVFAHRYLPAEPLIEGNPVLSIYQTDIIYYGRDLGSYLAKEFKLPIKDQGNGNKEPRRIRFWSDIIEKADMEFESERGDR